jgi:DNA adenine methylase
MKVTAIAPWFGSKRTLAPEIVKAIGPHRAYFEPFCGSMAVLFAKDQCTMETVNDLHGDLINLARMIQNPATWPVLFSRLQRTFAAKELWRESHDVIAQTEFAPTLDRAYHWFVDSWLGRNGTVGSNGGNNFCIRYTSKGGQPATRFSSAVDSLPTWAERLRRVVMLNEDGFKLLERIEDLEGTVIYCDPPYIVKGAKYRFDFEPDDHERLATLLHRFRKTKVVVSYYDHPDLESLYPDWQRRSLDATKAMVNMGARDSGGAVVAPEILLINKKPTPALF